MTQKSTILIADKKQFLVDVIKESFHKELDCVCVTTEEELFEKLPYADAIVVGLDVCLSNLDNRIEMIARIRSRFKGPIVALTSILYSSTRISLLQKGADDVLTKPFNPDELVVRTKKLITLYSR